MSPVHHIWPKVDYFLGPAGVRDIVAFEWSRQAADGSTITEQAPLFGDLIDAVKWYADCEEGDAGEPPDFAPGTNARRRAPKTPPTKHGRSRLLSAMSFRSTRSLAAASESSRSAASSRKSYRG